MPNTNDQEGRRPMPSSKHPSRYVTNGSWSLRNSSLMPALTGSRESRITPQVRGGRLRRRSGSSNTTGRLIPRSRNTKLEALSLYAYRFSDE